MKQVHLEDTYLTDAGGGAFTTMCKTLDPFSRAIFLSLIVCLYLASCRL